MTGQEFGQLKVISFSHVNNFRRAIWNCLCSCGKTKKVSRVLLMSGDCKSCGCLKTMIGMAFIGLNEDLTGLKIGRLTVIERDFEKFSEIKGARWKCICECGNFKSIRYANLANKKTKSCGCLDKENRKKRIGRKNKKSKETLMREEYINHLRIERMNQDIISLKQI